MDLCRAIEKSDKKHFDHLVEKGEDLTKEDRDGVTPLVKAVNNYDPHYLHTLLSKGVDPNTKMTNCDDLTPLHYLVKRGASNSLLKMVIDHGATVDEKIIEESLVFKSNEMTSLLRNHLS